MFIFGIHVEVYLLLFGIFGGMYAIAAVVEWYLDSDIHKGVKELVKVFMHWFWIILGVLFVLGLFIPLGNGTSEGRYGNVYDRVFEFIYLSNVQVLS